MADDALPDLTNTSTVLYKSRDGSAKELHVKQPMNPNQITFTLTDLQILAREIAKVLKEDAF